MREPSLVEACRADRPGAWRRLVAEWAVPIYRWSVFLGLAARDAEDCVQDVLSTAAQRIDRCASDEVLGAWLYQITRRQAANARRLAWCRRVFLADDDRRSAFEPVGMWSPEEEVAVRRILRGLPRTYTEILLLMDIEGFTRREASCALGISEPAAASRLRRARAAFRDAWDGQPGWWPAAEPPL